MHGPPLLPPGKKGVEIEGASDMGGLDFFCTTMELPDGDTDLLLMSMDAMNAEPDPEAEDRKGCSGHVGKMIYSAGVSQVRVDVRVRVRVRVPVRVRAPVRVRVSC